MSAAQAAAPLTPEAGTARVNAAMDCFAGMNGFDAQTALVMLICGLAGNFPDPIQFIWDVNLAALRRYPEMQAAGTLPVETH